jgi:hypothetical protein
MPPSPAVSRGPALADNLKTLGKMQRGDMLAKADTSGRLVRKTNWLTQKHNSSRTHDADLFAEIKEILTATESKIEENDQNPENEFTTLYVNAIKGLETLLQTYRSKGSKETDLIDQLTLVLVEHVANIEKNSTGPQEVDSLMAVAKQTVKYVQDCRIRSTNNNFMRSGGIGWSYYDRAWDEYLLVLLVRGSSDIKGFGNRTARDLKTVLLDISRRPISRNEKRRLLATELNGFFKSDDWLNHLRTMQGPGWKTYTRAWTERGVLISPVRNERERHKRARRALRTRFGNCGEKTAVAATHLAEATRGTIGICRVGGKQYDHGWVLISRHKQQLIDGCRELAKNGRGKGLLPRDTVVVDGWTKDWWGLRDWFNPLGNTRQLAVRRKIRAEIADHGLEVDEEVNWPPFPENSYFRLRYAHLTQMNESLLGPHVTWATYQAAVTKLKQYRATLSQVISPITLHQLVDNPDFDAVEDLMSEQSGITQQIQQEIVSYRRQHHSQLSQAGHTSFTGRNSLMPSEQSSVAAHHSSFRSQS